jgi:DNA polymerase I-like protein with 3'-5' exonuclease and polymerase domains
MLRNLQNEAANFPHQSTASDYTLVTAIRVQEDLRQMQTHIVDLVHDSMVLECPDNKESIESVSRFITAEMQRTPTLYGVNKVPFLAEIKQSHNWGNAEKDS